MWRVAFNKFVLSSKEPTRPRRGSIFSLFFVSVGRLSGISLAFQHTLKSKESGCAALGSLLSSYSTEWPESSQAKASSIVNCRQKQLHIFSERLNYLLFTTTITTYARIHGATILLSGSRCISNGKKKYIKNTKWACIIHCESEAIDKEIWDRNPQWGLLRMMYPISMSRLR